MIDGLREEAAICEGLLAAALPLRDVSRSRRGRSGNRATSQARDFLQFKWR